MKIVLKCFVLRLIYKLVCQTSGLKYTLKCTLLLMVKIYYTNKAVHIYIYIYKIYLFKKKFK